MAGDVIQYQNLVTSEHADKPNFMAMIAATCQPHADLFALLQNTHNLYDLDQAVGAQLDVLGQWVGVSRYLTAPLAGVYFAFDAAGVGFDQGVWQGPFDPTTGLVTLPDDYFRLLIQVRVLNNVWNGSKEDAYTIANEIFAPYGYSVYIEDYGDLSMSLGLVGPGTPSAILKALLTSGKFNIKPATIKIAYYINQTVAGPIFGFDISNSLIGGFDVGGWAAVVPG